MMMHTRIRLLIGAAMIAGLIATPASAAPTTEKIGENFNYLYEMDALLGSLDLDGNATSDWFSGTAGGVTQPSVSGGLGLSDQAASPPEILWRTDFGGSLTRATVTGDFTLDISLRLKAGTQTGTPVGTFAAALQQPGETQSLRLNIDEDNVSFDNLGTGVIATTSNTDAQHVYRIAHQGTNNWYIWRDGVLLNANLATPIAGSNGNVNSGGLWFLGDFTSSITGEWEADYIRVTEGAFAPNITVDNLDLPTPVTTGAQSNYAVQSFTPNVGGIGLSDTVADNAPLPSTVYLQSATFLKTPDSGTDSTDGQIYIDVYLGDGNDGVYIGSSTNSIDVDAAASSSKMTWFFDNLNLDSTLEYALVFSTDAIAGSSAIARLTAANNGAGFISTYSGGEADNSADGNSPVAFDARFAVRYTTSPVAVPAPAALPAGIMLLAGLSVKRRRAGG